MNIQVIKYGNFDNFRFDDRIDQTLQDFLKQNGYSWSKKNKVYYPRTDLAKEQNAEFSKQLLENWGSVQEEGEEAITQTEQKTEIYAPHTKKQQSEIREKCKEILQKPVEEITEEDKQILSQYEGGGGLKESNRTTNEVLNAFYTPENLVSKMWEIADYYAPNAKTVLEPSAGIGRFAKDRPNNVFTMHEVDETSAKINKILNPNANVIQGAYQEQFLDENRRTVNKNYEQPTYDIVIGNPPYGVYKDFYKGLGEGKEFDRYEEYFISKGIDALKDENSILLYVVPSSFLNSQFDKAKEIISNKAHLVDAFRLPEGTFNTTSVGTDIIVLKKGRSTPIEKYLFADGIAFDENNFQKQILGEVKVRTNRFGREENYVTPRDGKTVEDELEKISYVMKQYTKWRDEFEAEEHFEKLKRDIQITKIYKLNEKITNKEIKQEQSQKIDLNEILSLNNFHYEIVDGKINLIDEENVYLGSPEHSYDGFENVADVIERMESYINDTLITDIQKTLDNGYYINAYDLSWEDILSTIKEKGLEDEIDGVKLLEACVNPSLIENPLEKNQSIELTETQLKNDEKLSEFIAIVNEKAGEGKEYASTTEYVDDENNSFTEEEIFYSLYKQFSEYIDGKRTENQLYGGNTEQFANTILEYTNLPTHYFEVEDLCLKEFSKYGTQKIYNQLLDTNFYSYSKIPVPNLESIKEQNGYLNDLEEHIKEFHDENNLNYLEMTDDYLGHSTYVKNVMLKQFDDFCNGKIQENELWKGNIKDFAAELYWTAAFIDKEDFIQMAKKEVESKGTASFARTMKDLSQSSDAFDFITDDHSTDYEKIFDEIIASEKTQNLSKELKPFTCKIIEKGNVITYETFESRTKSELYTQVAHYFESNKYGWQVERKIADPEMKEEFNKWRAANFNNLFSHTSNFGTVTPINDLYFKLNTKFDSPLLSKYIENESVYLDDIVDTGDENITQINIALSSHEQIESLFPNTFPTAKNGEIYILAPTNEEEYDFSKIKCSFQPYDEFSFYEEDIDITLADEDVLNLVKLTPFTRGAEKLEQSLNEETQEADNKLVTEQSEINEMNMEAVKAVYDELGFEFEQDRFECDYEDGTITLNRDDNDNDYIWYLSESDNILVNNKTLDVIDDQLEIANLMKVDLYEDEMIAVINETDSKLLQEKLDLIEEVVNDRIEKFTKNHSIKADFSTLGTTKDGEYLYSIRYSSVEPDTLNNVYTSVDSEFEGTDIEIKTFSTYKKLSDWLESNLQQEEKSINNTFLEEAQVAISEFTSNEYNSVPTFDDLEHIGIAYTTNESEESRIFLDTPENRELLKDYLITPELKAKQVAQNWAIDKIRAAGIEVISDKNEFDRILESKEILQKAMQNKKSLKEQIEDVLEGNLNRFDSIYMCDTPQLYLDAGLKQLPMLYSQNHVRNALREEYIYENSHGLSKENLLHIPEELENPVMIMDSATRPDSIVVVTSIINDDKPLIVSVKPNGLGFYDLKKIDSNFITSIYGREGFKGFVKNAIKENRMLYCNKEKSQALFSVLQIQFPQGLNNLDFNKIIKQSSVIVNNKLQSVNSFLIFRQKIFIFFLNRHVSADTCRKC